MKMKKLRKKLRKKVKKKRVNMTLNILKTLKKAMMRLKRLLILFKYHRPLREAYLKQLTTRKTIEVRKQELKLNTKTKIQRSQDKNYFLIFSLFLIYNLYIYISIIMLNQQAVIASFL